MTTTVMRKLIRYHIILLQCLALTALTSVSACRTARVPAQQAVPAPSVRDGMFSPNTLIIMYDRETGKDSLMTAVREYRAELIYDYHIIPGIAISKPEDKTIEETMRFFRNVKGVVSVERDRINYLHDTGVQPVAE